MFNLLCCVLPAALHVPEDAAASGAPVSGGSLLSPLPRRHCVRQNGLLHHQGKAFHPTFSQIHPRQRELFMMTKMRRAN